MRSVRGKTFNDFNLTEEEAILLADQIGNKWDLDLLDKFELDHGIIDSLTGYKLTDEVAAPGRGNTVCLFGWTIRF